MRNSYEDISVCALVPYPVDTTPSQRFRIEQWLPYLKQRGVSVDMYPFADENLLSLMRQPGRRAAKAGVSLYRFGRHFFNVAAITRYDVVLIHRAACIAGPAVLERLISLFRKPIIYDFDDAIFMLHSTETNRQFGWLKFPGKTASICRLSSSVVVGNSYLADYARKYNQNVHIVPTSIDIHRYQKITRNGTNSRVIIGWTGSSTSQTHLEMFAPVLRKVLEHRDVELRVISDREPTLPGIPYVWLPWSPETEVDELSNFDIGIMPMPDDQWARGKCALKALQYMSMGIPAVCSAVGTNREVIRHGENGLLASSSEEWITCLNDLIDNPALRQELGRLGRSTVEMEYSVNRCADLFAGVIQQTIQQEQNAARLRFRTLD